MFIVNFSGAKDKLATQQYMAGKIVEITRERGFCTPSDLSRSGLFSEEEVEQNWPMANSIAQVKLMADDN